MPHSPVALVQVVALSGSRCDDTRDERVLEKVGQSERLGGVG
jgi:hypothetical protein